jgi:hypothetical protein
MPLQTPDLRERVLKVLSLFEQHDAEALLDRMAGGGPMPARSTGRRARQSHGRPLFWRYTGDDNYNDMKRRQLKHICRDIDAVSLG